MWFNNVPNNIIVRTSATLLHNKKIITNVHGMKISYTSWHEHLAERQQEHLLLTSMTIHI